MIKFATVGSGKIVDSFLDAAKRCPGFVHSAVYSRTEDRARAYAQKHGVEKIFTSLEALAADGEIDAVYIASPNYAHMRQTVQMLGAGKHVICEKPIGVNEGELDQMIAASKKNGVVLFEAMKTVFTPQADAVRKNLDKLGTIRRATMHFCRYSSQYDLYKSGTIPNIFKPELSTGSLLDLGVYPVTFLVELFGMPKEIHATTVYMDNGCDGTGTILANYGDKLAEVIYSKITASALPSEIQGEDACMTFFGIGNEGDLTITYRDGRVETVPVKTCENNMMYEILKFQELIEKGGDQDAYHNRSRMAIRIMDEARRQLGIKYPTSGE